MDYGNTENLNFDSLADEQKELLISELEARTVEFVIEERMPNKEIGNVGEEAVSTAPALKEIPILRNIPTDKFGGDIDHILVFSDTLVINECKNTNGDFKLYWGWFETHVLDRYVKALPIVQDLARISGVNNITFSLTIPTYELADARVADAVKALDIKVIETRRQIFRKEDFSIWHSAMKRFVKTVQDKGYSTASLESPLELQSQQPTYLPAPSTRPLHRIHAILWEIILRGAAKPPPQIALDLFVDRAYTCWQ